MLIKKINSLKHIFYYHLFFSYNYLLFRSLIFSGKKIRAFNYFINFKYNLKLSENFDPFLIFLTAMIRISPEFTLSALKLSGIIYWVPAPITLKKKVTLVVRWIVKLLKSSTQQRSMQAVIKALKSSIYKKGVLIAEKKKFYSKGLVNRHLLRYFS